MKSVVKRPWTCWKCQGSLKAKTIEVQSGLVILQFVCVQCRRPYPAGVRLRRMIAA